MSYFILFFGTFLASWRYWFLRFWIVRKKGFNGEYLTRVVYHPFWCSDSPRMSLWGQIWASKGVVYYWFEDEQQRSIIIQRLRNFSWTNTHCYTLLDSRGILIFWLKGRFYYRPLSGWILKVKGDFKIGHQFFSKFAIYQESLSNTAYKWV